MAPSRVAGLKKDRPAVGAGESGQDGQEVFVVAGSAAGIGHGQLLSMGLIVEPLRRLVY